MKGFIKSLVHKVVVQQAFVSCFRLIPRLEGHFWQNFQGKALRNLLYMIIALRSDSGACYDETCCHAADIRSFFV